MEQQVSLWLKSTRSLRTGRNLIAGGGASSLRALILCVGLSLCCYCEAEDIYISQSGGKYGKGNSPEDTKDVKFLNDPGNWSSPQKITGEIGPGDTIHLVGEITSQIIIQEGGTNGRPIEILFEPGAAMRSAAWPDSGAIAIPFTDGLGLGYITIDGGQDGVIENLDNGSELGSHVKSTGIRMEESHDITIRNLKIQNLYVHPKASSDPHSFGICVEALARADSGGAKNIKVTHCVFHDARIGYYIAYGKGWSDFDYSYCTVFDCNWGGVAGDAFAGSSLTELEVHNNCFRDWANWDDTSTMNRNHHNGFYGWAVSGGVLRDARVFANIVGPHFGGRATSGVYFSGNVDNIMIYNNLFTEDGVRDRPMDGFVFLFVNKGNSTSKVGIYNNTFIGDGSGTAIDMAAGQGREKTFYEAKNNLAVNVSTFLAIYNMDSSSVLADNNLISVTANGNKGGRGSAFSASANSSAHFMDWTEWKALGYDIHSIISSPMLGVDYRPLPGSPLVSKGENLSRYFKDDKAGMRRPEGLSWDIGAFEHVR